MTFEIKFSGLTFHILSFIPVNYNPNSPKSKDNGKLPCKRRSCFPRCQQSWRYWIKFVLRFNLWIATSDLHYHDSILYIFWSYRKSVMLATSRSISYYGIYNT